MGEFLRIALTFPTAFYSLLLIVVVAYWLFVMVGVLDLDLFDVDVDLDLDLDVDIGIDGAADGALEGAADGAVDGAAEAGLEGGASAGAKVLASVFSALSLGLVPITISFSFFTLYGWVLTFSGVYYLATVITPLIAGGLFAGATILALVMAGITVRPMRGIFQTHTKHGQDTLIGSVCVVTTGRVDARFGQANFSDGGAGLILPVRCDTKDNGIKRGDRVLIIGYDSETRLYQVEPYEHMDGRRAETELDFDTQLKNASSAAEMAAEPMGKSTGGKK